MKAPKSFATSTATKILNRGLTDIKSEQRLLRDEHNEAVNRLGAAWYDVIVDQAAHSRAIEERLEAIETKLDAILAKLV